MSDGSSARTEFVPSHGVGRLLTPWQPGIGGNPSGKHRSFKEVRQICGAKSLEAAEALIRIVEDVVIEDGRKRNREDGRIVVVAAQTILTWAFGKPPDYDPRVDGPPLPIDLSRLTSDDLRALQAIIARCAAVGMVELAGDAEVVEKTESLNNP